MILCFGKLIKYDQSSTSDLLRDSQKTCSLKAIQSLLEFFVIMLFKFINQWTQINHFIVNHFHFKNKLSAIEFCSS